MDKESIRGLQTLTQAGSMGRPGAGAAVGPDKGDGGVQDRGPELDSKASPASPGLGEAIRSFGGLSLRMG